MRAIKPPRLRPGDLIGFVAPASPVLDRSAIEISTRYVESLGYRVKHGAHLDKVEGYLAGTDEERAADVNAMFADPEVRAIFAIRGGYGTPRLLRLIDYTLVRRHPKIFVGFSDITALQLAIWQRAKLITFSGPLPAVEFAKGKPDRATAELFWRALTQPEPLGELPNDNWRIQKPGIARGILLGGNLSMLVTLLGTPFCPSFVGAVLLIEDVGEQPYRIDRMLTQLRNAGAFERIRGLLTGQFSHCEPKDATKPGFTPMQVLEHAAESIQVPVIHNLSYGHIPKRFTAPFGARIQVNGDAGTIRILESAVA